MADYCTLRTGGKAAALLVPSDQEELARLLLWLRRHEIRWRVIGRGSNILIRSGGFDGVVIVLGGEFCGLSSLEPDRPGETRIEAGAGCSVGRSVGWCARRSLTGLEFMVGIPGSIGGAVRMNAGAWGHELGEVVESITYFDQEGNRHQAKRSQLEFSYRKIQLLDGLNDISVIVGTTLRLKPGKQTRIIATCREYMDRRNMKQPLNMASAGSFFKNPPHDSAGRLIDSAGLKGYCRGGAMVSPRHANFIVNTGQATADDIVELMQDVQQKVYRHCGVMLEPEVHFL